MNEGDFPVLIRYEDGSREIHWRESIPNSLMVPSQVLDREGWEKYYSISYVIVWSHAHQAPWAVRDNRMKGRMFGKIFK